MIYIILISASFVVGVLYSDDVMPIFKRVEKLVLGVLAKRLSK